MNQEKEFDLNDNNFITVPKQVLDPNTDHLVQMFTTNPYTQRWSEAEELRKDIIISVKFKNQTKKYIKSKREEIKTFRESGEDDALKAEILDAQELVLDAIETLLED